MYKYMYTPPHIYIYIYIYIYILQSSIFSVTMQRRGFNTPHPVIDKVVRMKPHLCKATERSSKNIIPKFKPHASTSGTNVEFIARGRGHSLFL